MDYCDSVVQEQRKHQVLHEQNTFYLQIVYKYT